MRLPDALKPLVHDPVFRLKELAAFYYVQRIKGFGIPDKPHFDDGGTQYFMEALSASRFYLEYGSGGSTVEAARRSKPFICVDSDRFFLEAVKEKIKATGAKADVGEYIYCDIGLTGPWGAPVFKSSTGTRTAWWKCYPQAPWGPIERKGELPDLILVDGRFRVACALTCIQRLGDSDYTLLVDDYGDRAYYREIERFARLESMAGRMAIFKPIPNDSAELMRALTVHLTDWR